ncbi:MAG: hypothetical protein HYY56_00005, partial [Candidatus Omnitrophica bacterium]|nr:hypothetical protein [Candidatus Omnitrophota bacterium]
NRLLPIEYDEVTVTRKVFRSSESEYYVNKTLVRLKDIENLFMDTGIGTESYSLIEQGKIDLVLSSKPEDRRFIFEEAAGITKYKARKREALRKLEQTDSNLLRVNDIISEVGRQINSIERQAKKARRYQEEFEKLKNMEIKLSSFEYENIKKEQSLLKVEKENLKQEEAILVSGIGKLNEETLSIQGKFNQAEEELLLFQAKGMEVGQTLERNKGRVALNRERIAEIETRRADLTKELESIRQKMAGLDVQRDSLSMELKKLVTDRISKEELIARKEGYLAEIQEMIETAQRIISESKADTVEIMANQARYRNDLTKVTTNINNINMRLRRLEIEKEKVSKEREEIDNKLTNIHSGISELNKNLELLKQKRKRCEEDSLRQAEELQRLDLEIDNIKQDLTSKGSRLEFLEDLKRRHEGFSSGVKAILDYQSVINTGIEKGEIELRGICGVLADFLEVEAGYEIPVEVALGDDVQSFIVESISDARAAIDYLNRENKGRAKFFPLEMLNENRQDVRPGGRDACPTGKRLTDFVKIDDRYSSVISYLLDGFFLVDNLDRAKELLQTSPRSEETGLLMRDAKIRQLGLDCAELKTRLAGLDGKRTGVKEEIGELGKKVREVEEEIHGEEIKAANKESEKINVEVERKKFLDELSLLDIEITESREEEEELKAKEIRLGQDLLAIEDKGKDIDSIISSNQALLYSKSKERESVLLEVTQWKGEFVSIKDSEEHLKKRETMLIGAISEANETLASREDELARSLTREDDLKKEIVQLEQDMETNSLESERIKTESNAISKKKESIQSLKLATGERLKEENTRLEEVKNSLRDSDVKDAGFTFKLESIRGRIDMSYRIDMDTIVPSVEEVTNWDEVRLEIDALKGKLDSMGTVNLVAIEEEKELKDRFSFLTTQQADLVNAKESLHKAILKINKTTRTLFLETFEKIQRTFKEYFKALFGGGDAELVLVDQEDILESGIEIIARPPGKKFQSISLFSGGEKALTAISLLFAVFKIKPSPFCVLDEIDAPLDEANVDRFTKVLQDFVKTSQFIIITHNKKTIGMADVMYGVTMEESGISKIVSVK